MYAVNRRRARDRETKVKVIIIWKIISRLLFFIFLSRTFSVFLFLSLPYMFVENIMEFFLFSPMAISVCLIFNFNTICILSERERDLLFTQQAQTFLHLLLMSGQTPEGCKRNLYSLSGNF